MTCDELRARCEEWLKRNVVMADDYGYLPPVDQLMRLCRQMQAEGMRMVIREGEQRAYGISRNEPLHTNYLRNFIDWCESTANELEASVSPDKL